MLKKHKKLILTIGGSLTVLCIVIGIIIFNSLDKNIKITEETFTKVIGDSYTVKITSNEKDILNLDIVGEPSKETIKSLYDLGGNLGKTKLNINFFEKEDLIKDVDKFYIDGLTSQVELDYLTKIARVGKFETIENIEKANNIADYDGEKLAFENKVVNLSLNMALTEDTKEEAMSQAKAFIGMFKSLNKDKDISSVQININDGQDVSYSYSSEFENLVKEIETTHF